MLAYSMVELRTPLPLPSTERPSKTTSDRPLCVECIRLARKSLTNLVTVLIALSDAVAPSTLGAVCDSLFKVSVLLRSGDPDADDIRCDG